MCKVLCFKWTMVRESLQVKQFLNFIFSKCQNFNYRDICTNKIAKRCRKLRICSLLRCYGHATSLAFFFSLETAWLLMLPSFLIPLIILQKKIWWKLYRPPAWTSQMRGREISQGRTLCLWIAKGICNFEVYCMLSTYRGYPSNTWKPLLVIYWGHAR